MKEKRKFVPGDIVNLCGIEFAVLDKIGPSHPGGDENLFILAVKSQGRSRFGDSNNYAESDLRTAVLDWLGNLVDLLNEEYGCDRVYIADRKLDLMTLDGYKGYGSIEVAAAPLTLDEARKYAEFIPECDEWTWLATGWGGPDKIGSDYAWLVGTDGSYYNLNCTYTRGVRPALIVPSSLFEMGKDDVKAVLKDVTDDELLEEIRRRFDSACKEA